MAAGENTPGGADSENAPPPQGPVHGVLALYGAFDRAVTESKSALGPTVDRFLPRYSSNTGWYRELQTFLFGDDTPGEPDVAAALERIIEADQADDRLNQPQKFRLLYALSTLGRLQALPNGPLPIIGSGDMRERAIEALAAAGPTSFDRATRLNEANSTFDDFLSQNPKAVGDYALQARLIGEQTSQARLCRASSTTVRGLDCVRIDTEATSPTLSLQELKNVVNPYNWDENYPEFFLEMTKPPVPVGADGWRRVIEKVKFGGVFDLTTPLKFHPYDPQSEPARLDYDLDTSQLHLGDGRVLVDQGHINMYVDNPTNDPSQPGVKVRTRKIVHIEGISPFAQERLVCLTGYGTASADFLFGRAKEQPEGCEEFHFPRDEADAAATDVDDTPVSPPRHAVPAASQLWVDTLGEITRDYAKLAEKWWSGALTFTDVAQHCESVGGKLFKAPVSYWDEISRSRYRTR